MATVIVNRLEVEPAPPEASEERGAKPGEPEKPKEISRHDVEKAIRAIQVRAARVWAH